MSLNQQPFYTVILALVEMEVVVRCGVGVCRPSRMKGVEIDSFGNPLLDEGGIEFRIFIRGHYREWALRSPGNLGYRGRHKTVREEGEGGWGRVASGLVPWTAVGLVLYFRLKSPPSEHENTAKGWDASEMGCF